MADVLAMIGVTILIVIIIWLVINLARKETPIQRVEQNRMFSFLTGMLGYSKDNPLNGNQLGDFYQENRVFKKDGVKISISLSKDNDRSAYSFEDRRKYYTKMQSENSPGSKQHSKASSWLKNNKGRS